MTKNNALKRKYESRFNFSPPPPPDRWRVSPEAGASAFSGVWVFSCGNLPILAEFI